MSALWRWLVRRRMVEEWARTSLTVLGVALGIAVFVSVRLASHSARASFSDTVDAVAGTANLQVVATSDGFDERLFLRVLGVPGIEAAAPVVERYARARMGAPDATSTPRGEPAGPAAGSAARSGTPSPARPGPLADAPGARWPETLLVLGVDVFREAPFARYRPEPDPRAARLPALLAAERAAAIPKSLAERHGLRLGDTLTVLASGRPEPLVVREVLAAPELEHVLGGNVVIVDLATAQEVFRRFGRIDRIDLLVDPSRRETVRRALASRMPAEAAVDDPRGRTRQVENMVRAFDLNLTALSFIAVFVAMFLIFNAVAMSVLRWRREIGILRGIGVTRRQVLTLFLGEGLMFGAAGTVLGLALGGVLARGALRLVSRTLTDLYLVQQAGTLRWDAATVAVSLAVGLVVALVSALAPAAEASRTPPGVTMRQGLLLEAQPMALGRWALAGLGTLALAALVVAWTVRERRPIGGFAGAALVLAGFTLLAPAASRAAARLVRGPARRLFGVSGALGVRMVHDSVARVSVVVAATLVAVGMWVALDVMVRSFRSTVDTWVGQTLRGDLYVEPVGHRESGSATALPESLVAAARALPGVVAVDTYRGTRIVVGGRPGFAAGVDFGVQARRGGLRFVTGRADQVLERARAVGGVIVTESFAHHYRVGAGDTLRLDTPAGRRALPVLGVFYDYTTDAGAVLMDRERFAELWRDGRTESMALYLGPGADVDRVRSRLLERAGDLVLSATPNRELRRRVLEVFDQTFQITYALQGIAVVVAVLGVIGTLTALVLQRGREIGVLRAIGARRAEIRRMVLVESGLIGVIGAALGCACGAVLALLLIHVVNRQFFGWTIRASWEPAVFAQAVLLMAVAAVLAGLGPARLAATRVAAEAMRAD